MVSMPSIPPSYALSVNTEFDVLNNRYGDGYGQRAARGINSVKDTFRLSWELLTEAEYITLRDFFKGTKGVVTIEYTPPTEVTDRTFIVKSFSGNPSGFERWDVQADLEETFDP